MSIDEIKLNQGIFTRCRSALSKIGEINQKNVWSMDNSSKQTLRDNSPERLIQLAKLNCFAADKIKTEFDIMYGKNKYVIIAIGRSIASIAETLGRMGVDTRIIPLSGLQHGEISEIQKDDLLTYKAFLAEKGLSKTDLYRNKNKKYILMDYAHSRSTLEKTDQLLRKPEMLGDAPNLINYSINEILGKDFYTRHFDELFQCYRFKDYSYVGKLNYTELGKVYQQSSPDKVTEYHGNITKGLRNLFWFNVFDSLNTGNYKDILPFDEYNAVYKHYLSPKAAANFRKRLLERNKNNFKRFIVSTIKTFL